MFNTQEDTPQKIKYVVVDTTIEGLIKRAEENANMYQTVMYEKHIYRNFDETQRRIQTDNHWATVLSDSIRINEHDIEQLVKNNAYAEIEKGTVNNLKDIIFKNIMETRVRECIAVRYEDDGNRASFITDIGDCYDEWEYSIDLDKMVEDVKEVKCRTFSRHDSTGEYDYAYIEDIKCEVYNYYMDRVAEHIEKYIKRFFRTELTYCTLKGSLIVPKEYTVKGEEGIKEWRELKASKNKANSMEKRMLRTTLREKKAEVFHQMQVLLWRLPCANDRDWTMPFIMIDGSGNKNRVQKLTNQIIGGKTDSELLAMSSEDVEKEFKKFWKDKVMNIYNGIDDIDTMEK